MFGKSTFDPIVNNPSAPAGVQTEMIDFSDYDEYPEVIYDQYHPGGLTVAMIDVHAEVSASGSALINGRPGDIASASTNGIGIQTNTILMP